MQMFHTTTPPPVTGVSTYKICAPRTVDTSSNACVTCGISAAVYTLSTCREDSHSKNMDTERSYMHTHTIPWCTIPTPPPQHTYVLLSSIHLYICTYSTAQPLATTSLGNGHTPGNCHMCEKHGKEITPLIQGSLIVPTWYLSSTHTWHHQE